MSEEDSFWEAIEADPTDFTARLVFADWLQERDDVRAAGMRALAGLRRYPDVGIDKAWWSYPETWSEPKHCHLPDDWMDRIIALRVAWGDRDRHDTSRGTGVNAAHRKMEHLAALAFAELPPERQAELLSDDGREINNQPHPQLKVSHEYP